MTSAPPLTGLDPRTACVHGTPLEAFACPKCEAELKALTRKHRAEARR